VAPRVALCKVKFFFLFFFYFFFYFFYFFLFHKFQRLSYYLSSFKLKRVFEKRERVAEDESGHAQITGAVEHGVINGGAGASFKEGAITIQQAVANQAVALGFSDGHGTGAPLLVEEDLDELGFFASEDRLQLGERRGDGFAAVAPGHVWGEKLGVKLGQQIGIMGDAKMKFLPGDQGELGGGGRPEIFVVGEQGRRQRDGQAYLARDDQGRGAIVGRKRVGGADNQAVHL